MSAEQKVSSYVFAVTITLMAAAFAYIPQFHEFEQHPLTGILVGALTGTGLFEALAKLVELAFKRVRFIKKLILGASYLEGCWVGFYISTSGQPRLLREFVRQDWSSVFITGQAFNIDGTPHGQWRSVVAIVKGEEGLLRGDLVGDLESGHYDSLIEYQLEGEPPKRRSGRVVDIVSNQHAGSAWLRLTKVSNKNDLEEVKALDEARSFLQEFQQSSIGHSASNTPRS
jgi:hypothetical protein